MITFQRRLVVAGRITLFASKYKPAFFAGAAWTLTETDYADGTKTLSVTTSCRIFSCDSCSTV